MAECQIDEIVSVAEKIFGRLGQRAMSLGTVQEHYGDGQGTKSPFLRFL